MAKKRTHEAALKDEPVVSQDTKMKDEESDQEDFDIVNVEFEWFNFDPVIDFHGTKTLLRQLFDVDSTLQDISGLADLILSQPTIGSTVKVDGKPNDPYALCTALNISEYASTAPITTLTSYLATKSAESSSSSLGASLGPLLEASSGATIAVVFCERLINIPVQIAPPLYSMLIDEIAAAVDDGEPYKFTHYLVVSRVYTEVESTLVDAERRAKRAREAAGIFYFHAEDEILQEHAVAWGSYDFTNEDEAVADSKRAFQDAGIKTQGHLVLIEAEKFAAAVKAVEAYVSTGGQA